MPAFSNNVYFVHFAKKLCLPCTMTFKTNVMQYTVRTVWHEQDNSVLNGPQYMLYNVIQWISVNRDSDKGDFRLIGIEIEKPFTT